MSATPSILSTAESDEFLTKKELAARLKINVRTIERWQRDGEVPHYKFRNVVLFHWPELLTHLKAKYRVASRGEQGGEAEARKSEARI